MFRKIIYSGYVVDSISFNTLETPEGEGSYELNLEPNNDLIIGSMKSEDGSESFSVIRYPFKANVSGYAHEDHKAVFTLDFSFTLFFETSDEISIKINEEFLQKEQWFFTNFAQNVAREVGESIFNHTVFKGLRLPLGRK